MDTHEQVQSLKKEGMTCARIYKELQELNPLLKFEDVANYYAIPPENSVMLRRRQITVPSHDSFKYNRAAAYSELEHGLFVASAKVTDALVERAEEVDSQMLTFQEMVHVTKGINDTLRSLGEFRRLEEGKSTANVMLATFVDQIDEPIEANFVDEGKL